MTEQSPHRPPRYSHPSATRSFRGATSWPTRPRPTRPARTDPAITARRGRAAARRTTVRAERVDRAPGDEGWVRDDEGPRPPGGRCRAGGGGAAGGSVRPLGRRRSVPWSAYLRGTSGTCMPSARISVPGGRTDDRRRRLRRRSRRPTPSVTGRWPSWTRPGRRVLWPEHFDVGIDANEVNYGVSPGDASCPEPYAYVGPWHFGERSGRGTTSGTRRSGLPAPSASSGTRPEFSPSSAPAATAPSSGRLHGCRPRLVVALEADAVVDRHSFVLGWWPRLGAVTERPAAELLPDVRREPGRRSGPARHDPRRVDVARGPRSSAA